MALQRIDNSDALDAYSQWPSPTTIISDGAYGIKGFVGDPKTPTALPGWYEPHVEQWTQAATNETSLWFWNTEVGWASCHQLLTDYGWQYVQLVTWDKGIQHVAGNVNGQTIRRFPVATEVSALYVRPQQIAVKEGTELTIQDWLRSEWKRSGLPFSKSNEACGVKNAASRKWLASDFEWYMPPYDMFEKLKAYANQYGKANGAPYFESNVDMLSASKWTKLRSKWNHQHGHTNVWNAAPLRNVERVKDAAGKFLHTNQKPLELMSRQIRATSDPDDTIWEPFGGLCSATVAAKTLNRNAYAAETNPVFYKAAMQRLLHMDEKKSL